MFMSENCLTCGLVGNSFVLNAYYINFGKTVENIAIWEVNADRKAL